MGHEPSRAGLSKGRRSLKVPPLKRPVGASEREFLESFTESSVPKHGLREDLLEGHRQEVVVLANKAMASSEPRFDGLSLVRVGADEDHIGVDPLVLCAGKTVGWTAESREKEEAG